MNLFSAIASLLFFLWSIRNTLSWVYLWQVKEYRFDRVLIHLRETRQGKMLLFSPFSLIKWAAIIGYGLFVLYGVPLIFFYMIVIVIFGFDCVRVVREYFLNILKRPVFTLKALFLIIVTISLVSFLLFVPLTDRYLWFLILDKLIVIIIGILVLFFTYPTEFYRDATIEKAIKKIRSHKKLLVIGVTGSYGKSSTKDYVAQILEKKFSVLKTKGTNNTPIGIANTILSGLRSSTEIFVVEMGAYKKGEITHMTQIVHPKIGILTGISNQHLSLFQTIETTMQAKYELIDSLPKDGTALFNGNNNYVHKLYKKTRKQKVLYQCFLQDNSTGSAAINAFAIKAHREFLTFAVAVKNKILQLKTPLIGAHNIENILPGIYIANILGMKDAEIKNAVAHLSPLPETMILHESKGVTYIDDTFNASPDAVSAAISYMLVYRKKRILVLQPMIELGKNAALEHYMIGKKIGKVCDYLFLTNRNFFRQVEQGVTSVKSNCKISIGNANEIAAFISTHASKGDVIVFEGKEAAFALHKVL